MAKLVNTDRRVISGVQNPVSYCSRVFGLACKAAAGIGNGDFAYSPPLGQSFLLRFMSIWYGGCSQANGSGGNIYISSGTGIPVAGSITNEWEIVVPFWAGTTKPGIMVLGTESYMSWPMSRLYTREALRFGLEIENGSAARPFWVNVWFEISEG